MDGLVDGLGQVADTRRFAVVINFRCVGLVVVVGFISLRTESSTYMRGMEEYTKRISIKNGRGKNQNDLIDAIIKYKKFN